MKKEPKFIDVTERPIIIVGEKMGKQRLGQNRYALEGNGTGDFVHEAIGDRQNIILTNIVNYFYPGDFKHTGPEIAEGISDLIHLIEEHQPSKIICLGNIAAMYTRSIRIIPSDCVVVEMRHPSWVNRFKSKERHEYIKLLTYELEQRIQPNQTMGE